VTRWKTNKAKGGEDAMEIRFRNSIALVKNIEESKQFYRDIIGLSVAQEYDTFVLFMDNFAIHTADLFYEYIQKPYHGERMGHDNVDFYFTTSDLEGFQARLKEHGVTFIHEIHQHAWGEKVIRVYDPDGHILEIGDAHTVASE
jgi:catechol 2,3-dioxygenase-like lactoylglutathione lyase family enzyme